MAHVRNDYIKELNFCPLFSYMAFSKTQNPVNRQRVSIVAFKFELLSLL